MTTASKPVARSVLLALIFLFGIGVRTLHAEHTAPGHLVGKATLGEHACCPLCDTPNCAAPAAAAALTAPSARDCVSRRQPAQHPVESRKFIPRIRPPPSN